MAGEWEVVSSGDEALTRAPSPKAQAAEPGGATFMDRVKAGFKSSPESERNFYAAKYGEENARLTRDNEVEIKRDGKWLRADPEGLDVGDIADMAGAVPEIIAGAIGGVLGSRSGNPLLAAGGIFAGGALGNVAKQAIGAALPGENVEGWGSRASGAVLAGAMNLAAEGVGKVAYQGVIKPAAQALYERALAKNAPAMVEARAIESGVNRGATPGTPDFQFTPGEETGGRALAMVEDAARNSLAGADTFYHHAQRNLAALSAKALRLVDEVRGGARPMSDLATGAEVQTVFKEVDDAMLGALEDRAARDFAFLQDPIAGRFRFDLPNFKQTLANLASRDINSVGAPGAIAEGVGKLTAELPDQFTAKDINLYLKRLGRTGYGKGDKGFMEQLGDTDRAKMARQLFAAMSKDVEDLATSGQPGHTLAAQLRGAKDSYAAGLAEIDGWQNGLFAKVVGDYGPESAGRIVDNLFKLNPAELKSVSTVLGYKPDVANAVRASWIDRAFQKSQNKMLSRSGAGEWFNARTFADALGTPAQLEAVFGRTHRQVLNDLILLQRAQARMNAHAFSGEAPLAGMAKVSQVLDAAARPTRWPGIGLNLVTRGKLAGALLDPNMRANLEVVANAKAPTRRVVSAITNLFGQEAADLPNQ